MSRSAKAVGARRRRSSGFTLIELVITVAILALLASAVVPLAEVARVRSKESELRAALRTLRGGIDAYKRATDEGRVQRAADESGYPKTLEALVRGVPDAKDPGRKQVYFLRRIPRDPFADAQTPAALSWGVRSYESPPEAPQEGKDVFDVYSRATAKGLNGIPYNEW
ncbi:MAG: type II secretion system protein [Burkholderiales bacterium]|nr:type II secretion system protein [Burkholderiales bacterium]